MAIFVVLLNYGNTFLYRINISQKIDLAMRETEQIQVALDDFIKKSHRAKCNMRAELEEFGTRGTELMESRELFENTVVIGGVDRLTQRIPAEKFLRSVETYAVLLWDHNKS